MATAQNVTNWFDLQNVSKRCISKVRKFQLDTLSRFRMVEEKQEGAYLPPPPGKIGLMSNHLIIPFLYLESHYLFSVRSQQHKGTKVRQVKSVMRCCSHFHPLCIPVKDQVRFLYHNITPLLGNEISKHHYRFHFVKID